MAADLTLAFAVPLWWLSYHSKQAGLFLPHRHLPPTRFLHSYQSPRPTTMTPKNSDSDHPDWAATDHFAWYYQEEVRSCDWLGSWDCIQTLNCHALTILIENLLTSRSRALMALRSLWSDDYVAARTQVRTDLNCKGTMQASWLVYWSLNSS